MTQQQECKEELWGKYCMQGDAENPDRMFYEQFCLAVEEVIQKAKEEEKRRIVKLVEVMKVGGTSDKWISYDQALTDLTNNLTEK